MHRRPDILQVNDFRTGPVAFSNLGGECKSTLTIYNLNRSTELIGRAMSVIESSRVMMSFCVAMQARYSPRT